MKISKNKYEKLRKNYVQFLAMRDNGIFEWEDYKNINSLNEFSIKDEVEYEIKRLRVSGIFGGIEVSPTDLEKLVYASVVVKRLDNMNVSNNWNKYPQYQNTVNNYYEDDDSWFFDMLATQMIINEINDQYYDTDGFGQDDNSMFDGPENDGIDNNVDNMESDNDDVNYAEDTGDNSDSDFNNDDSGGFFGDDSGSFGNDSDSFGDDSFGGDDSGW